MADHKAARERCTAFLKEKTEVIDPQDLPILDECPICLDTYVLEQSIRIKIKGCTHVFGRNCLTAMLTNNPRLEKRCPLCRTLWMDAPARAPAGAPSGLIHPFFSESVGTSRSNEAGIQRPSQPTSIAQLLEEARPSAMPRSRFSRFPTLATVSPPDFTSAPSYHARQFGEPNQVVNLIDSDDDEDPLESFHSFTREINSVRERARNTQRKPRKEEKKKNESATPMTRTATTSKRDNNSSSRNANRNQDGSSNQGQQSQQQQQQERPSPFPSSFWNPPPRARPSPLTIQNLIQENWGLASGTHNEDQSTDANAGRSQGTAMDIDDTRTTEATQHNQHQAPRTLFGCLPGQGRNQISPQPDDPPRFYQPPPFGSLRDNQQSGVRPIPFLLSPTPESDNDAARNEVAQPLQERLDRRVKELQEREARLEFRQRELALRETGLDNREKGLSNRERFLEGRDRQLAQREEQIRQREANDTQSGVLRQRQLQEMELMIARHREEMRG